MADVQTENGFTRIANNLLEEIIRYKCGSEQKDVLLAIIRLTYGYSVKARPISISLICKVSGINKSHVSRSLSKLISNNVIIVIKDSSNNRAREIELNKDFDKWQNNNSQKAVKEITENDDEILQTDEPAKEILEAEIIGKPEIDLDNEEPRVTSLVTQDEPEIESLSYQFGNPRVTSLVTQDKTEKESLSYQFGYSRVTNLVTPELPIWQPTKETFKETFKEKDLILCKKNKNIDVKINKNKDLEDNKANKSKKSKNETKIEVVKHSLQIWIEKNCTSVAKMPRQMTYEQCENVIKNNIDDAEIITKVLEAMENRYDLLKKYKSVYLTLKNWIINERNFRNDNGYNRSNRTNGQPATKGEVTEDRLKRSYQKYYG